LDFAAQIIRYPSLAFRYLSVKITSMSEYKDFEERGEKWKLRKRGKGPAAED
jgi:hypothetical protein